MSSRRDRQRWFGGKSERQKAVRRRERRLHFEELERVVLLSTFTVTNTNGSGAGSLAQAISDANNSGGGEIKFNIGGGGHQVISSSGFAINSPIFINGASQPNPTLVSSPLIELRGPGTSGTGLLLNTGASGSVVAGLFVTGFNSGITIQSSSGNSIGGTTPTTHNIISGNIHGIRLAGAGTKNNTVVGNFIGTDPSGSTPQENQYGVVIEAAATENTIGGNSVEAANVISGNAFGVLIVSPGTSGNVVKGNLIGTDISGTAAIPNTTVGVGIYAAASGNTIGGTTAGSKNVISGNSSHGIIISGVGTSNNLIAGNLIGTDASGTLVLANPGAGILISDGASGNTVGGTTSTARNVINGAAYGVELYGTSVANNVVSSNYIGTDASGTLALGNTYGVLIGGGAVTNVIGGTSPELGNLISGNTKSGVYVQNAGTTGNAIQGNLLGTNSLGTDSLGDTNYGVVIQEASGNLIGGTAAGAGNVIAFSKIHGVTIGITANDPAIKNAVLGNWIYNAGNLGIDLGSDNISTNTPGGPHSGPNHLQNFPVLTAATSDSVTTFIQGTLNSTPNTTFRIEFFTNPTATPSGRGQGRTYLGWCNATTDSNGNANYQASFPSAGGPILSATATDPDGNTSEFAPHLSVGAIPRQPMLTSATAEWDDTVTLTWTDVTGETGYRVERSSDNGGTWTIAGTVGAGVTTFTDTGSHTAPIYAYRVFATNETGDSVASLPLSVATTSPAPTNLTATPAANDRIHLSWTDTSTNEQGFKIERSTDGVNFTQIGTVLTGQTAYTATGLATGTSYQFRVRAYKTNANSAYSNVVTVSTTARIPSPPTDLALNSFILTWLDASDNEQGFKVERSTDGVTFNQVATTTSTPYSDSNLTPGTRYYYRVRAYNAAGDSEYSSVVSETAILLSVPSFPVATTISSTQIDLTWRDYSNYETDFRIERSSDGVNFVEVGTAPAGPFNFGNPVTYQATGLSAGTTYYFRVRASNSQGFSDYSWVTSSRTSTVPTTPTNLTATPGGNDRINLAWTRTSTNEQGFKIERSTDGGNFTQVATTTANTTSYVVTGLASATTYLFRVRAYNGDDSAFSNTASAVTTAIVPAAPFALRSDPLSSSQINLSWAYGSNEFLGFKIERSTDGLSFSEIATLSTFPRSYQVTGLIALTTYHFRVRAYNIAGSSTATETTTATTTSTTPADPTGLTATAVSNRQVDLTWTDNANNVSNYFIERSTDGVIFSQVGSVANNVTKYRANNLTAATTYSFRVRASNGSNTSGYSSVATTTTLSVSDPTSLAVVSSSPTQVSLSWSSNTTGELGTKIERSTDGVNFTQVGAVNTQGATSYSESNLSAGTTYYYRVRTYTSTTDSGYSNVAAVTTLAALPPTSLSGTAASSTQINLSWIDNSNNETGFKVERSTDDVNFEEVGTIPAGPFPPGFTVTYQATGLSAGTLYYFRVRAYNAQGNSTATNVVPVRTSSPPTAPTNLTATPASTDRINLAWTDTSDNEPGFEVERSTDGVIFTRITTTSTNVSNYVATGLTAGTTYYFRVRGSYGEDSPYSATVSTTTIAPATPAAPTTPLYLRATTDSSSQISLNWGDASENELGFKIERSTDGVIFTPLSTVSADFTSYSDRSLTPGTTYYYRVRAYNSGGDSGYTSTVSASTLWLDAPAFLTAMVISSDRINLTWGDYSGNETGFKVERSTDGVNFEVAGIAPAGFNSSGLPVTYQATGLSADTAYYFRVRATNDQGDSPFSNITRARTIRVPAAPINLTATPGGNNRIDLAWTDVSPNDQGFKIEQSTDGVIFTQVATTGTNQTSYSATILTPGTTYYFRVRASNGDDSAYSNTASAQTTSIVPIAPKGLTATVASNIQINLAWLDASENVQGYKVEQSSDGVNFTQVATASLTSTTISGLTPATTYYFRVRSYNAAGSSVGFAAVLATTAGYPVTPTGLTASPLSDRQIRLNWQDVGNENGYKIEREINGVWTQVGAVGANITTFTDDGLSEATTYSYRILAYNAAGNSPYSGNIWATTPLAAPTITSATFVHANKFDFTWADRSAFESNYMIQQSPDGSTGWIQVGWLNADTTSFSLAGPFSPSTTYYFRIGTYQWSTNSLEFSATTSVTTPAFPLAPTGLTAVGSSDTNVTLTWTNVAGEDGYRVERSVDGLNGWTSVGTVGADVTTYVHSGLTENTRSYYRVIAFNAAGDSLPSASASALTLLATPGSVAATFVSGSRIDVTWTDRSTAESSYFIERWNNGSNIWQQVGTTSVNVTSFSVTGPLNPSTTYLFRVRAYLAISTTPYYSAYSTTAEITTPAFPPAPTGVAAVGSSASEIGLTWTDVAGEDGYRIERSPTGTSGWSILGTVGAGVTSYSDAGLPENSKYFYRVVAFNSAGESPYSASASALSRLAPPTIVSATSVSGSRIDLTWTDHSAAESGYSIQRSLDGTTGWQSAWTVPANTTSFSVPGPFNPSTTYYFRIWATATTGVTSPYASTSVTTLAFPAAPSGLTATPTSDTAINISWSNVANEDGYRLERSLDSTNWATVSTLNADVTSFADTGLQESKRYYYRVIAFNTIGDSATSVATNTLTLPTAPDRLSATVVSASRIDLAWTDRSNTESGYRIEMTTNTSGPWTSLGTVNPNVSTYSVVRPFDGSTTYYFRVSAYNSFGGVSSYTTASLITPAFPNAPSGLTATPASDSAINISWLNVANEDGYRLERSLDSTTWSPIATLGAEVTTFADTGLQESKRYYYRVIAFNVTGDSAYSATTNILTLPTAPDGLSAIVVSATRIDFAWIDRSNGEAGFKIEQSTTASGPWTPLAAVTPNISAYSSAGPFDGSTTYYFRVSAYNASGNSTPTATSTTTGAWPSRPVNVMVTPVSSTEINVSWSSSAGASSYVIERSPYGSTGWIQIGTVDGNTTSYADSGLIEGTAYSYRVRASNGAGDSASSSVCSTSTPNYPPSIIVPASANPSTVTGKTTSLSVLGDVQSGETRLRYTWSVVVMPSGAPTPIFSVNDTNAAKNATVTFAMAGDYIFRVTVTNGTESTTSEVSLTVQQTLTSIVVTPATAKVLLDETRQLTAKAKDQFGRDMDDQPTFNWALTSGSPGKVSSSGLYTAPEYGGGVATVRTSADGITGTASLDVGDRIVIGFDDASASEAITDQYTFAVFSADSGKTNWVHTHNYGNPGPSLGTTPINPGGWTNNLYVDFIAPVNDLTFLACADDSSGVIAKVKIYTNGSYLSTKNVLGTSTPYTPETVDLTEFKDITRIEIVEVTDAAGLTWDEFSFTASCVDLDVDSDNSNDVSPPDRTEEEDDAEDPDNSEVAPSQAKPGKVILVNTDDTDGNGSPDFMDGYGTGAQADSNEKFVPLVLQIPDGLDLNRVRLSFVYNAASPGTAKSEFGPTKALRIWTKNGSQVRDSSSAHDGGDYVAPNEDYTRDELANLELSGSQRTVTFYIEGLYGSSSAADQSIKVKIAYQFPNGSWKPVGSDLIRLTVLEPFTDAPDGISADDHEAIPVLVVDGVDPEAPQNAPLYKHLQGKAVMVRLQTRSGGGGWSNADSQSDTIDQGAAAAKFTTSTTAGTEYRALFEVNGYKIGSAVMTVVPGSPDRFDPINMPNSVPADGVTQVPLTVTVRDQYGNLVPDGTPVEFRLDQSNIKDSPSDVASPSQVTTVGGIAQFTVVAGTRSAEVPSQVIHVQAGNAEADITIGLTGITLTVTNKPSSIIAGNMTTSSSVTVQTNAAPGTPVYFLFSNGGSASTVVGAGGSASVQIPTQNSLLQANLKPGQLYMLVSCGGTTINSLIRVKSNPAIDFEVNYTKPVMVSKPTGVDADATYQTPRIQNPIPGTTVPNPVTHQAVEYRNPGLQVGEFQLSAAAGTWFHVDFTNSAHYDIAQFQFPDAATYYSLPDGYMVQIPANGVLTVQVVSTSNRDGSGNLLPRSTQIPISIYHYTSFSDYVLYYPNGFTATSQESVNVITRQPSTDAQKQDGLAFSYTYDVLLSFLGGDPASAAGIAANMAGGMLIVGDVGSVVKNLWRMAGFSNTPVNYYELTLSSLGLLTELLPLAGEVPDGVISGARAIVAAIGVAPLGGILMEYVRSVVWENVVLPDPETEAEAAEYDAQDWSMAPEIDGSEEEEGSGAGGGEALMFESMFAMGSGLLMVSPMAAGSSAMLKLKNLIAGIGQNAGTLQAAKKLIRSKQMFRGVEKLTDDLGAQGATLWRSLAASLDNTKTALTKSGISEELAEQMAETAGRRMVQVLTQLPGVTANGGMVRKALAELATNGKLDAALSDLTTMIAKSKIDSATLSKVFNSLPANVFTRWSLDEMLKDLASVSDVKGFRDAFSLLTSVPKAAGNGKYVFPQKYGRLYEFAVAAQLKKSGDNVVAFQVKIRKPGTQQIATDIDVVTETAGGQKIFWQVKRTAGAFKSPSSVAAWVEKVKKKAGSSNALMKFVTRPGEAVAPAIQTRIQLLLGPLPQSLRYIGGV